VREKNRHEKRKKKKYICGKRREKAETMAEKEIKIISQLSV
jgi:hypothetical protein